MSEAQPNNGSDLLAKLGQVSKSVILSTAGATYLPKDGFSIWFVLKHGATSKSSGLRMLTLPPTTRDEDIVDLYVPGKIKVLSPSDFSCNLDLSKTAIYPQLQEFLGDEPVREELQELCAIGNGAAKKMVTRNSPDACAWLVICLPFYYTGGDITIYQPGINGKNTIIKTSTDNRKLRWAVYSANHRLREVTEKVTSGCQVMLVYKLKRLNHNNRPRQFTSLYEKVDYSSLPITSLLRKAYEDPSFYPEHGCLLGFPAGEVYNLEEDVSDEPGVGESDKTTSNADDDNRKRKKAKRSPQDPQGTDLALMKAAEAAGLEAYLHRVHSKERTTDPGKMQLSLGSQRSLAPAGEVIWCRKDDFKWHKVKGQPDARGRKLYKSAAILVKVPNLAERSIPKEE